MYNAVKERLLKRQAFVGVLLTVLLMSKNKICTFFSVITNNHVQLSIGGVQTQIVKMWAGIE